MKMHDVVPKIPLTYRDSPVTYVVVMMVVSDVEYLPSKEGVLKYCKFGIYSRCIDCIPPSGDEFGLVNII